MIANNRQRRTAPTNLIGKTIHLKRLDLTCTCTQQIKNPAVGILLWLKLNLLMLDLRKQFILIENDDEVANNFCQKRL